MMRGPIPKQVRLLAAVAALLMAVGAAALTLLYNLGVRPPG
jgi:hypothetical protein